LPAHEVPPEHDPFRMHLLRRATATALSSVLLLQLLLLSGWERCAMNVGAMEAGGVVAMSSGVMDHMASNHAVAPTAPQSGAAARSSTPGNDLPSPPPCEGSSGGND